MEAAPDHDPVADEIVDDVLIPIKYLVNGTTVVPIPMPEVTYYHIAFDQHDVLLADGLPAESLLPTGDRAAFENGDGPAQLPPVFTSLAWDGLGCAPLVVTGTVFGDVERRLLEQARPIHLRAA